MQQFYVSFALFAVIGLIVATLLAKAIGRFGFPLPPVDRRLGHVDGLRGYLALSVLAHHLFIWIQLTRLGGFWSSPSIHFLNQLGAGSVGLFFMTTGLVFYPRVLTGFRSTPWISVYITRAFRITPLVVLATALVTVVVVTRIPPILDTNYIWVAVRWITTWSEPDIFGYSDSGRINAYVLWSLWYEWLFYLMVLPACALAMDRVRTHKLPTWTVPLTLFVIGVSSRFCSLVLHFPVGILFYLPLFATGMLVFELRSDAKVRAALARPSVAIAAAAALFIGMIATATPYSASLPLFAFFFASVACGNSLGGLLSSRGALILGECSFGIYLLHGILLDLVFIDAYHVHQHLSLDVMPILLPIMAVVIVITTSLTYLLVERPAMRAGKSLVHWFAGRRFRLPSSELEIAP